MKIKYQTSPRIPHLNTTSVPLNLRIGRLVLSRKFLLDRAYTYIIRILGLTLVHYWKHLLELHQAYTLINFLSFGTNPFNS